MSTVIGMDEAGYGPNLGPLVVTATAWDVEGDPTKIDFWALLDGVVSQKAPRDKNRLHIADSKKVYTPAKGIRELEKSVLCLLRLVGQKPQTFQELRHFVTAGTEQGNSEAEPWFENADLPLPQVACPDEIEQTAQRLQSACNEQGIRLKEIRSDVVLTERFNRLTTQYDSKGVTLSKISMGLIQSLWDPDAAEKTLVIADKHGGRNRYDGLLDEILDGQMIFRLEEGTHLSNYRVGNAEVRFQTKAEAHFPVAVSSLFCKYLRELSMDLFNRFWCGHVPGLKPTKGYPVDAKRFRADVELAKKELEINDQIFWRSR